MSDALRLELYISPYSPPRRKRIVAVAVLVLNLAVLAMDHQFGLLVLRDLPGAIHRVLLAVEHLGVAPGTGTPDRPTIFTGNHMLIALAHTDVPCHGGSAATWVCGRQIRRGHSQTVVRAENHDRTRKGPGRSRATDTVFRAPCQC